VGEATRGQVKAAEHAVRSIREVTALDEPTLARVDHTLTDAARDHAPGEFRQITQHLVRVMTHDAGDRLDEHELERRKLVLWRESDGWTGVDGYLPPDIAAPLWAAMDRWAKPHPANEADADAAGVLPIYDRRSTRQRHADALGLALRLALGADSHNEPDRPHVVIHVRTDSPVTDEGLAPAWVAKYLCDATVKALRKNPTTDRLELGYNVRTATPTQRQALIARDRTCVIPNCTIPARWAEAHHVRWWSHGGPTNVSSMAMVCGPHHADVHAGIWELEIRDGIPWAKPPTWLDPEQRWRRNTYQHHLHTTEQLAIDIHPPNAA